MIFLSLNVSASIKYNNLINKYASRFNVPPEIVKAVISVESNYKNKAVGPDDYGSRSSYGLMQIQIETAKDIGYKGDIEGLFNPEVNIAFGIKYLRNCIAWANGNLYTALDMYNRGVGFVRKYPYKGKWDNHRYVNKVLKNLSILYVTNDMKYNKK